MKMMIVGLVLLLTSNLIFANGHYQGQTAKGKNCYLQLNLEHYYVIFATEQDGFRFILNPKSFKEAINNNKTSLEIHGDDGEITSQLVLNFANDGSLIAAIYKKTYFSLFTTETICSDLEFIYETMATPSISIDDFL